MAREHNIYQHSTLHLCTNFLFKCHHYHFLFYSFSSFLFSISRSDQTKFFFCYTHIVGWEGYFYPQMLEQISAMLDNNL